MTFPQRGIEIIQALYHASPQDDTARRRDIQKVGEQLCHDLGPQWGNKKRAGVSDDLRSPDSIAFLEADLTVSVWDIQASSGAILVHAGKAPDYPHLGMGEAAFMPCDPKNHLAGNPLPGEVPNPPDTGPPPVDLGPVLAELAALHAELAAVEAAQAELIARVDALEDAAARPLRVVGRTESMWGHRHFVDLDVRR
jgi:hypothetical protein